MWAEAKCAKVITEFKSRGKGKIGLEYGILMIRSLASVRVPARGKRRRNVGIYISVHEGEAPFYQSVKRGDIIRVAGWLEQQQSRRVNGESSGSGWIYIHPETVMMLQTVDGRKWDAPDLEPKDIPEDEEGGEVPV